MAGLIKIQKEMCALNNGFQAGLIKIQKEIQKEMCALNNGVCSFGKVMQAVVQPFGLAELWVFDLIIRWVFDLIIRCWEWVFDLIIRWYNESPYW